MFATIIWVIIFIVSLVTLVKSADWLVLGAERIGLALGMSPFVVGVLLVGIGTSFPELISSFAAVLSGVNEMVVANAVGSNVANILLIIGSSAIIGTRLVIDKDLIDLDLPLIAISTVLFLGVVFDGVVTFGEGILLLIGYGVYLSYIMFNQEKVSDMKKLPSRLTRRLMKLGSVVEKGGKLRKPKIGIKDFGLLIIGIIGLAIGAKYLVDSVIALSDIWNVGAGSITIIAVAFGTSLPELIVSIKAALQNKSDIALGNIFGSNAFNILVVVGLPGLFAPLVIDHQTLYVGVPAMVLATALFVISGISRRIHLWEGAMYLIAYVLFIGKIFQIF
jgi:cation:H+ antiporter